MDKVLSLFKREKRCFDFSRIIFSLISPELIESRSYGVVKKPETINYRTYKPERDGLFCAKIFGPIKDYECLCGKYKRLKHRGVICEKCGVEVTFSKVRRYRMAHIELASPVAHIWFLKSLPSRLGLLLNLSMRDVERVLYFESYIVLNAGITPLKKNLLLDEKTYIKFLKLYGDSFVAKMGAEAILELLSDFDLKLVAEKLRHELENKITEVKLRRIRKRLQLIELFIQSGNKPEWMILTVLPVLPPDLRPLVPLEGGRFATSDLNDLYRRVINRNNRLKKLLELNAPDIIVRNEKRMLQEAVDSLFDNGRRGKPIVGSNKRPLKSLSDIIKGKQGRFRQNLLGKRVDYSGRSVIVVGPFLKLHQCGLPKEMALELFKPFLLSKLDSKGIANIKYSKKLIECNNLEVYEILKEIVHEYPILLNRAPTLHRLGVQAFEPILIEGRAIQLHPLVCIAFNADFDGDQMAVHIPLSIEAQLEAKSLMLSSNNILSPANGQPSIVPSQDILLGLYYLTMNSERNSDGNKYVFFNLSDVCIAYEHGVLDIHQNIRVFRKNKLGEFISIATTVGRVLFYDICPSIIDFFSVNVCITKTVLISILDLCYRTLGIVEAVNFSDKLMHLGFEYATISGVSICIDDLHVPLDKGSIISDTTLIVKAVEKQYSSGLLTQSEKYNRVIDLWSLALDKISTAILDHLSITKLYSFKYGIELFNSVYIMLSSGARGSITQLRQLSGMRGLMVKPDGSIIETPIISNFREGLNVLQYFTSTHGSRKGLADTALKTANSGYLTRRLVDVAQDVVIVENDCGTVDGVTVSSLIEGSEVIVQLRSRILGRVLSRDVILLDSGFSIKSGVFLTEHLVDLIELNNIDEVTIRSSITCSSRHGICSLCYGRDLSHNNLVNKGEAVGVIAAQSIGEPGTQLTMRTFHVGGAAFQKIGGNVVKVKNNGVVKLDNIKIVVNEDDQRLVISRYGFLRLSSHTGKELERYLLPYGAELLCVSNEVVKKDQLIARWDLHSQPIIVEVSGKVKYINLVNNVTMETKIDSVTGVSTTVVIKSKKTDSEQFLKPSIEIYDSVGNPIYYPGTFLKVCYYLLPGTVVMVSDGINVHAGDIIARMSQKTSKIKDITGGLPKVADLFEARVPKNSAVLAVADGVIGFLKEKKGKTCISITDTSGKIFEMFLKQTRDICVYEGEFVKRGDIISEGLLNPHDLLSLVGVNCVTNYLLNEVQSIYRLQGVTINDKHIEVILRQMLHKVLIYDVGDSVCVVDQIVDFDEVYLINKMLKQEGKNLIKFTRLLLGITKASLLTNSFVSAASFQETTKILTDAAICGKKDYLYGLKENVIVGRLIPAGTGLEYHLKRKKFDNVDKIGSNGGADEEHVMSDIFDFTLNGNY